MLDCASVYRRFSSGLFRFAFWFQHIFMNGIPWSGRFDSVLFPLPVLFVRVSFMAFQHGSFLIVQKDMHFSFFFSFFFFSFLICFLLWGHDWAGFIQHGFVCLMMCLFFVLSFLFLFYTRDVFGYGSARWSILCRLRFSPFVRLCV